ncbi:MAG: hypothetical protein E3J21_23830 [Anaerolineales bacterium]|nr:MAG: hypothetical protein E3J21_23830 [Anaerolineales bacterium]
MILSTYDPNGQASCPTCKKLQKVYITGGLLVGHDKCMDSLCLTCETRFRIYMDRERGSGIEILEQGIAVDQ